MDFVGKYVDEVKAGEISKYVHIVEAFQAPLYRYCTRMLGNRQEAEDAVQDILVKGYEKIGMYEPTVSFSSWLYKIAHYHCLNLLRRRSVQRKFQSWFRQDEVADSAEQMMISRLFGEPLSSAIRSLSAEEHSLLILRVLEEKSFAEIGEISGKSTEAVKKKYGRLKLKLQKLMKWEGGADYAEGQSYTSR
ncbi:RNA polymerase sigma-70 factor (ECF subfamily) [Fontibacillus solani]|uniref:RNA polymerase sigma-70 factor (ECF subfamily) n=1 Tax=Fontibacillus solani TaxID=1572857 RepID=A0A7W3XU89_9BACL|nr:sigma-70 family RNA polymerase sigma factor [Fontibacillus solani]MBA9088592.1 RNA polymerase sigma-70 factor (ECF subfamily) [Fontibacillus solani]